MFNFGKPIVPREPIRIAKVPQPLSYDDIEPLDERSIKENLLEAFRKSIEESEE